ncbi:MAG: hypothetical protein AAF849_24425 [Bacteroidota bacterium]
MTLDKDTQQQFERYLEGKMSSVERNQFEAKVDQQKELSAALQWHREMEHFLADSAENDLRKNLQQLSAKVQDVPEKPTSNWKYSIGILVLLLIGILWYLNSDLHSIESTDRLEASETNDTKAPLPAIDSSILKTPSNLPIQKETPKASEEENTPSKQEQNDKIDRPEKRAIAAEGTSEEAPLAGSNPFAKEKSDPLDITKPEADARDYFEPLPVLADQKSLSFVVENLSIEVVTQLPDTIEQTAAPKKSYPFLALFNAKVPMNEKEWIFYIYSNSEYHWEQQTPWLAYAPAVEQLDDNRYRLRVDVSPDLETGRYYYLLRNTSTQQIYVFSDFFITSE